jgi:ubiquinone biosynthesis protein
MPFRALLFGRKYRNIGRISHIAHVFLGKGFGHFITQLGLHKYLPLGRVKAEPDADRMMPVRLREAFEELGPTFIKFGQILSGRPDLITSVYADEFKKLQDEVPPFPYKEAAKIIEEDLGIPVETLFLQFDKVPIAAASIAQVHRAILPDGTEVAVKVRRPRIEEEIEQDIPILDAVAGLLERHITESRVYSPSVIVDEFSRTIRREMDFNIEADNIRRFAHNFKDSDTVYIPKVFADYCSRRVLTMEHISGINISDIAALDRAGFDRPALANNGARAFFKQVLEDGFFHADPHPGNMFVLADGRIALLDFGMVGRLTEENMETIADTFLAIVNRDFESLVRQYIKMGFVTEEVDIDRFKHAFKRDLIELIDPLYGMQIGRINISDYLERITTIAVTHGLRFPRELILMNKALLTVEGFGRKLDPAFNFIEVAQPYAARLVSKKYSPRRLARRLKRKYDDVTDIIETMPKQVRIVLSKIIKDDVTVKMQVNNFEQFIKEFDRSTNRLSAAMIIAGITVSSSIIIHARVGTHAFGYPFLGLVGYLVAGLFGLWLVWGIIRSGRL